MSQLEVHQELKPADPSRGGLHNSQAQEVLCHYPVHPATGSPELMENSMDASPGLMSCFGLCVTQLLARSSRGPSQRPL
eukprot:7568668-Alexandrium_andersonii.AAC.1